ncbi:MAG: DUF4430 domain-containing protein [Clostridia bacterium]|nr:DUF4430 domain-containing protein [Clostridia bacterium]
MKNKTILICSKIISFVLIAAMALTVCSCKQNNENKKIGTSSKIVSQTELGNGKTQFNLNVFDESGNKTEFVIKTDEKTVGNALLKLNLISGDSSEYGLYVKEVNGITADYEKDKTFWAFYIDGKMASAGVDKTSVTPFATYDFKIEK